MDGTLSRRALLGAELPSDAEAFSVDGMRIAGVFEHTMADAAGLVDGDIVQTIGGHPVRTLAELAAALRHAGAHAEIEIAFARAGVVHRRTVMVETAPCEPDVDHGALVVDGAVLRTLTTRVAAPRAIVVVIQGIACESVDHALSPDAPLAELVRAWARAGISSLRFDKRGVGDSTGSPCTQTDFTTELADASAVLALAARDASARDVPLFVFGHSVGGIIAAHLASNASIAGVIVYGTPVMRWLACLQDSARRQLVLRGASEDEMVAEVARLARLAETGELNGRSAAYHAQLDALDLESAWRGVTVPVLVVRGEHDWVVAADDQARIAALAAGRTTIVDLPRLDHLFGAHADRGASLRDYGIGVADPALAEVTRQWLVQP